MFQIYPQRRHVEPDIVIGWAHDRMVDDFARENKVDADQALDVIPRPTLIEAVDYLEDAGVCTFQRRIGA